jgi:hypothetical protein
LYFRIYNKFVLPSYYHTGGTSIQLYSYEYPTKHSNILKI